MNPKTIEIISNTLTALLEQMQIPFTRVEVTEEPNSVVRANIETENIPFLIGTHGERINALQHVLKNILWKKDIDEQVFVIVDIDHYKKSREEKVLQIAKEKADSARAMQISQVMPPLDPYLRKLVHTYFNTPEYSDITTESIGEGSNRRLQLSCNPHS
jgi:spoIIIJ-associated protein